MFYYVYIITQILAFVNRQMIYLTNCLQNKKPPRIGGLISFICISYENVLASHK